MTHVIIPIIGLTGVALLLYSMLSKKTNDTNINFSSNATSSNRPIVTTNDQINKNLTPQEIDIQFTTLKNKQGYAVLETFLNESSKRFFSFSSSKMDNEYYTFISFSHTDDKETLELNYSISKDSKYNKQNQTDLDSFKITIEEYKLFCIWYYDHNNQRYDINHTTNNLKKFQNAPKNLTNTVNQKLAEFKKSNNIK